MATFKDPDQCFAPLEVIERLLQIRAELGFSETLYLDRSQELTDFLDAPAQTMPGDEALLVHARECIEELNRRAGAQGDSMTCPEP